MEDFASRKLWWILKPDHSVEQVNIYESLEWSKKVGWDAANRVAETQDGDIRVSTVFLGLDHSFGDGPPVLFETMVFGGPLDMYCQRYCTWDEAVEGHKEMVMRVTRAVQDQQQ